MPRVGGGRDSPPWSPPLSRRVVPRGGAGALGSHSCCGCEPRAGGAHLLGEACDPRVRSGGSWKCRPHYFILQKLWHTAWGPWSRDRDLVDRGALALWQGLGTPVTGVEAAQGHKAAVALYQLDLLYRAGDNCRQ
jgi:hypothetical protein